MQPNLKSLWNAESETNTGFEWQGYAKFMENRLTIIDKDKQEVPFKQKDAQLDFLQMMGVYYQLVILKARKMGFSSTALGVAVTKLIMGRNERAVTMSFDQAAGQKQLERAKHYIRSYERIRSEQLGHEFKLPLKYNTRNEIVLEARDDTGKTFINTLRCGTARSTSFGRGDDISFLHLTEVSLCDDVETLLSGVGEALVHNAHTVLETTANGFNSFKEFWDAAVRNEKGFAALFYSPQWEYDDAFLEIRRKKLGRLFKQEYPMTPEEAFLTSGDTYFDQGALEYYLTLVRDPINKTVMV